jgi:hypothetical protein
MPPDPDYLHNHPEFADLIRIVAEQKGIASALVEKDYWIMHCLHGLQQLGLKLELKGGTSLSKGHKVIDRFSEDIDIRIDPPTERDVKTGRNQTKPAHIRSRKDFYDWLASEKIRITGIEKVERDTAFDNKEMFSAGIRLTYPAHADPMDGLKPSVLLELGFDDVTPNEPKDISSWLYDHAAPRVAIIDNRAKSVPCYDLRYTFVEKLQTVSTKFRKQQETGEFPINFMRHYYDIHELLKHKDVQDFIGTEAYKEHKKKRFRQRDEPDLTKNEAFNLRNAETRSLYTKAFKGSTALYYGEEPTFDRIMASVATWTAKL